MDRTLDFNDSSVCAVVGNFKNKVAAGKGHIRGSAFFHVDFIRYSNLCGLLAFGRLLFLFFPDAAELFQHILKDGIRLFAFFQAGAYNGRIFSNPHIYGAVPARPSAGLQQQNKQNYIYSRQDANGNSAYYYYFPFGFRVLFFSNHHNYPPISICFYYNGVRANIQSKTNSSLSGAYTEINSLIFRES